MFLHIYSFFILSVRPPLDLCLTSALIFYSSQLFWTDSGASAKIESSDLDGANRAVVVNERLSRPMGLAIDYPAQRLYWTDAKKKTIETSKLDGSDRHIVKRFPEKGIMVSQKSSHRQN